MAELENFRIDEIIIHLYPLAIFSCSPVGTPEEQYSTIEWDDKATAAHPEYSNPSPRPTLETLTAAWPAFYLEKLRRDARKKVRIQTGALREGGITYNSTVYASDLEQLVALRGIKDSDTEACVVHTLEGTPVELAVADARNLRDGLELFLKTLESKACAFATQVAETKTVADVQSLDLDTGWPTVPYIIPSS